jgi:hypothetical protein
VGPEARLRERRPAAAAREHIAVEALLEAEALVEPAVGLDGMSYL